jgi:hypothetical protein
MWRVGSAIKGDLKFPGAHAVSMSLLSHFCSRRRMDTAQTGFNVGMMTELDMLNALRSTLFTFLYQMATQSMICTLVSCAVVLF